MTTSVGSTVTALSMTILADHEGLYELSRLMPAVSVALAMVLVSGTLLMYVVGRLGAGWYRAPGGHAALVAVAATLLGGVVGVLPRQTAGGYVVCGPVLHLGRADSELCDGVLDSVARWVQIAVAVAALTGLVAVLLAMMQLQYGARQ